MRNDIAWIKLGSALEGRDFARFQRELTRFNHDRLTPALPDGRWADELKLTHLVQQAEIGFVESARAEIAALTQKIPCDPEAFLAWYEDLRDSGPGQGDSLFPWLENEASLEEMSWFIEQEVAGEAGFEDLLAYTQVKMPQAAKLEMARNYWDEMGRGGAKGMHGPMLDRLAKHMEAYPTPDTVVPESLALGNMMVALSQHRRYAFHAVGALGVIELTAPTRAGHVDRGLRRLRVPGKYRNYFGLHAILDVKHSQDWNREVIRPLVMEDARRAKAIGEGALLRLWCGARCFDRYRAHFALSQSAAQPVGALVDA